VTNYLASPNPPGDGDTLNSLLINNDRYDTVVDDELFSGGVPLTFAGAYPTTSGAMNTALGGVGTFSNAWAMDDASGNLAALIGPDAMSLGTGVATYGITGPLGGADKAVGFIGATTMFNGNNYNITTGDLVIVAVWRHLRSEPTNTILCRKNTGPNSYNITVSGANLVLTVDDGTFSPTATVPMVVGDWYVLIAVRDRGATQLRMGTINLRTGAKVVGTAATDTTTASVTNISNFVVGSNSNGPIYTQFAAFYMGVGGSSASTMSTNMSTALTGIYNQLTIAPPVAYTKAVGENIAIPTDAAARLMVYHRSATENVAIPTESPARLAGYHRGPTENVAIPTDAAARLLGVPARCRRLDRDRYRHSHEGVGHVSCGRREQSGAIGRRGTCCGVQSRTGRKRGYSDRFTDEARWVPSSAHREQPCSCGRGSSPYHSATRGCREQPSTDRYRRSNCWVQPGTGGERGDLDRVSSETGRVPSCASR
jgi:hypothetical protein